MKYILFALKRTFRNVSFALLLAVYAAAICLASLDGAAGTYPPAGVCGGGEGESVQRIVSHLLGNGFVWFDDQEQMQRQIENGALDCGVVLPDDLAKRLEQGAVDGCVRFVTSPLSIISELYRSHASAAIFREYAPCVAADALTDSGIPREELLAEYELMFAQGFAFSFEILSVDGKRSEQTGTNGLLMGAAALVMFALILGADADDMRGNLVRRIGARKMLLTVVLPGTMVCVAAVAVAGGIGLWIAGAADLFAPLFVYALLLGAVRIFLMAVMDEARERYILIAIVLILSLALCPIFMDLSLFSPALRVLRCVLPPYWFFLAAEKPLLWLAVGCGTMIAACGALCARWRLREHLVV